jgi:ApbE superfamily uncharacterized protein (UPF0280 family)
VFSALLEGFGIARPTGCGAIPLPTGREAPYRLLRPGRVLVDHGPITMTVEASRQGSPFTPAALAGAERALAALEELARRLPVVRRPVGELVQGLQGTRWAVGEPAPCSPAARDDWPEEWPEPLRRMVAAVLRLEEDDFTPLAAVAGAIAELALEAAVAAGATRAIVNNGGDIALRVPEGERVRVGIVSDLAARRCTHVLEVSGESGIGGVATSGLGGRSLTKGIASAAVALSASASVADAAATAIANATNCDHPAIQRCLAEEIDPGTDIRGHVVTRAVGELPEEAQEAALWAGAARARALQQRGVVRGWVIFVGTRWTSFPEDLVVPIGTVGV